MRRITNSWKYLSVKGDILMKIIIYLYCQIINRRILTALLVISAMIVLLVYGCAKDTVTRGPIERSEQVKVSRSEPAKAPIVPEISITTEAAKPKIADELIVYNVSRIKSAKEIMAEYKRTNKKMPKNAIIHKYKAVMGNKKIRSGGKGEIVSIFQFVTQSSTIPKVEETLTLFAPDGTILGPKRKTFEEINEAGEYKVLHVLNIPKGAPIGTYRYKIQMFLAGKLSTSKNDSFKIATYVPEDENLIALMNE